MKRHLISTFLFAFLAIACGAQTLFSSWQASPRREVRAVWLTTLSGLDWPSRPARTAAEAERQQQELCRIFDNLQAAGINTILFQARIRSTTAYASAIEPWDGAFSGRIGVAPPYDPLAFAVTEAHRRGMELHAWVVAFPIVSVAQAKQLGAKALPRRHPELCRRCADKWMMDPGVPAVADYLASLCQEIAEHYDVDGIHLDYIRYPEAGIPWDDAATYRRYGQGAKLADWRRENVTRIVRRIHAAVKAVRPWLKLSCSPVGKHADLPRQSSYGWNARDAVAQDAQRWLEEGIMDWLFPMMYFDGRHFFPFACDWQENAHGRIVAPGLGIYFLSPREKNWPLQTVTRQLQFLRTQGLGGAAYFRSRFLTDNVKGLRDFLTGDFYRSPVLTPAMTWADSVAPTQPHLTAERRGATLHLAWTTATDNAPTTPVRYNVYRLPAGTASIDSALLIASGLTATTFDYTPARMPALLDGYAVTAMDAYGNECDLSVDRNFLPAASPVASSIPTCGQYVSVPADGLELTELLIVDAAGRTVCRLGVAKRVDVAALNSGLYELRGADSKGRERSLCRFWKKGAK